MMICQQLQNLLGFTCHPLNEAGNVAMIETPFTFCDGEGLPAFIESSGQYIRFFDDGQTLLHFMGRGMRFSDRRRMRPIQGAAERHGATLNDDGEIEVWSPVAMAKEGFAKYVSALLSVVNWEKESEGDDYDAANLIDEVRICFEAWKRGANIQRDPELYGISGHKHTFNFLVDGKAVLAIQPSPQSVSAAIRKTLDVISYHRESGQVEVQIVLDDRHKPAEAKDESKVITAVAEVLMMTRLEALAGLARA